MGHSGQKRIFVPNTINLRAKLDVPAKMHFIGHKSPNRSHHVKPISLSKISQKRVPGGQSNLKHAMALDTTNPLENSPKICIAKSIPYKKHPKTCSK